MSYHRKPPALGLGDLAQTITSVLSTSADVATDPYLPELICRTRQLMAVEKKQTPSPCAQTPTGVPGGFGIRKLMMPVRAVVYAEQHRWVYPAAVAGVIGVPLLVGYLLGKGHKR